MFSFRKCDVVEINKLDNSFVKCLFQHGSSFASGVMFVLPISQIKIEGDEVYLTYKFPILGPVFLPLRVRAGMRIKESKIKDSPVIYLCSFSQEALRKTTNCTEIEPRFLSSYLKHDDIVVSKIFSPVALSLSDNYVRVCIQKHQEFLDKTIQSRSIVSFLSPFKSLCVPSVGQIFY